MDLTTLVIAFVLPVFLDLLQAVVKLFKVPHLDGTQAFVFSLVGTLLVATAWVAYQGGFHGFTAQDWTTLFPIFAKIFAISQVVFWLLYKPALKLASTAVTASLWAFAYTWTVIHRL